MTVWIYQKRLLPLPFVRIFNLMVCQDSYNKKHFFRSQNIEFCACKPQFVATFEEKRSWSASNALSNEWFNKLKSGYVDARNEKRGRSPNYKDYWMRTMANLKNNGKAIECGTENHFFILKAMDRLKAVDQI